MREWVRTLLFALVVSAGMPLIAALALYVAPPRDGLGSQQEARVKLLGDAATGSEAAGQLPEFAQTQAEPATSPNSTGRQFHAADRYFRKSEVDFPAVPILRAPLVIPEAAYVSRLAGRVRARVFISADGRVDKIDILQAVPVAGVFEAAALAALRGTRYRAARIGQLPVKSQRIVDVVFDPKADRPTPGG